MKFWRITGFDKGAHGEVAIIGAEDEGCARERLWDMLNDEDFNADHYVWTVTEPATWIIRRFDGGDYFVLGGGCRE